MKLSSLVQTNSTEKSVYREDVRGTKSRKSLQLTDIEQHYHVSSPVFKITLTDICSQKTFLYNESKLVLMLIQIMLIIKKLAAAGNTIMLVLETFPRIVIIVAMGIK